MRITSIILLVFLAAPACAEDQSSFGILTVPSKALPVDCELSPKVGFPFGPVDQPNPLTTTNPKYAQVIVQFILESTEAVSIDAAYVAGYKGKSAKENVVWAIKSSDPVKLLGRFEEASKKYESLPSRIYVVKESLFVLAWTDDLDDLTCFNAIKSHLEAI